MALALVSMLLGVVAGCSLVRAWRASFVSRPFSRLMRAAGDEASLRATLAEVGKRFMITTPHRYDIREVDSLLNTSADYLLSGGSCGHASRALGTVFKQAGQPFRILQVNVTPEWGATHVMVEARLEDGRWVLADALLSALVNHPDTGRALTLEEARNLDPAVYARLPVEFQGVWDLRGTNRRTNWGAVPGGELLKRMLPEPWASEVSIPALLVEPSMMVAVLSALLEACFLWFLLARPRKARANTVHAAAADQGSTHNQVSTIQ